MTEFLKLITFSLHLLLCIFGSTFSKQPNYFSFVEFILYFVFFLFFLSLRRTKSILKTDKKAVDIECKWKECMWNRK